MTMDFCLNSIPYTYEELAKGSIRLNSAFERSTLAFCHSWLNNILHFDIRTSGSTGTPKVISFTRQQLEASARLTESALLLKKEYRALVCLPTEYIAGQMMLVRSLVTGMSIYATEPVANPFLTIPDNIRIDFAALVPYQLLAVLNSPVAYRLNEVKQIIIGGAPLALDVIDQLQSFSCSFYATYGMTETISHVALQRLNGPHRQHSFYPLSSIGFSKDERGCLVINAPHVSAEALVTNDLVDLRDDGSFAVLGRWDNVINTGGVKVLAEELERKIKVIFTRLQLLNRFFVAALPDKMLGEKVILVVEGESFSPTLLDQLSIRLKEELSRFELPKDIRFVSSFAETETQKLNRKKTLELIKNA
jgi:o-succinylbenzoate---CoA ligase